MVKKRFVLVVQNALTTPHNDDLLVLLAELLRLSSFLETLENSQVAYSMLVCELQNFCTCIFFEYALNFTVSNSTGPSAASLTPRSNTPEKLLEPALRCTFVDTPLIPHDVDVSRRFRCSAWNMVI